MNFTLFKNINLNAKFISDGQIWTKISSISARKKDSFRVMSFSKYTTVTRISGSTIEGVHVKAKEIKVEISYRDSWFEAKRNIFQ